MLFSVLVDQICGVRPPQSAHSGNILQKLPTQASFSQYPELYNIISSLLKGYEHGCSSQSTVEVETVLLALEILCRAGLPTNPGNILVLVKSHLRSPVWHIRVLAAKIYAISMSKDGSLSEIKSLLVLQGLRQNEIHGRLLCALNMCELYIKEGLDAQEGDSIKILRFFDYLHKIGIGHFSTIISSLKSQYMHCDSCPFTLAAVLGYFQFIEYGSLIARKRTHHRYVP